MLPFFSAIESIFDVPAIIAPIHLLIFIYMVPIHLPFAYQLAILVLFLHSYLLLNSEQ